MSRNGNFEPPRNSTRESLLDVTKMSHDDSEMKKHDLPVDVLITAFIMLKRGSQWSSNDEYFARAQRSPRVFQFNTQHDTKHDSTPDSSRLETYIAYYALPLFGRTSWWLAIHYTNAITISCDYMWDKLVWYVV